WRTSGSGSSVARIDSRACADRRWSSAMRTRIRSEQLAAACMSVLRTVTCYGRVVKGDEAHERIQKLLVSGDNRLKQGVDPAEARQSYEQALEAAREAGLEDAIRPLVEIRLADLERLARGSLPPSPPDA